MVALSADATVGLSADHLAALKVVDWAAKWAVESERQTAASWVVQLAVV